MLMALRSYCDIKNPPLPTLYPLENYSETLSMQQLQREEPQTYLTNISPPPLPSYMREDEEDMLKLLRMCLWWGLPKEGT